MRVCGVCAASAGRERGRTIHEQGGVDVALALEPRPTDAKLPRRQAVEVQVPNAMRQNGIQQVR